MSAVPECVNCGGKDFFIDSGFYFCSECQVQSQDVREQELENDQFEHGRKSKIASASPSKSLKVAVVGNEVKELTSWELANIVLAGLTKEVVTLSGEKAVKKVTFQLWASYLRSLEVAFTSSSAGYRPRLNLAFRAKDAELIYGTTSAGATAFKRAFSTRSSKSAVSKRKHSSQPKQKGRRRILKAAQLEYSESNLSTSFTSQSSFSTSKQEEKSIGLVKWTKDTKKQLRELIDEPVETRVEKAQKQKKKFIDSVKHLSMTKAIAILRLGIIMASKKILFSDLIRWDEEGYLSMSQMTRLVPKDCRVSGDLNVLLQQEPKSQERLLTMCSSLARLLGIKSIKVDLVAVCRRIVQRFRLPEETVDICRALTHIMKPNKSIKMQLSCEARAAALIIFVLKFLFGLDDRTEFRSSDAIQIINREQGTNLFVWTEWQKSVEHRWALEAEHSVVGRSYFSVDRVDAFIGQWRPPPREVRFSEKRDVGDKLRISIDRVLEPLSSAGREPKGPSPLIPDHPPNEESLLPFLDHTSIHELAEASGVKVVKGCARDSLRVEVLRISPYTETAKALTEDIPTCIVENLPSKQKEEHRSRYENFLRACATMDQFYSDSDDSDDKTVPTTGKSSKITEGVPVSPRKEVQREPTLYLASMGYRMFHISLHDDNKISIEEFEEIIRHRLSSSLYWLLNQMAATCRLSLKTIYFRLIAIEKALVKNHRRKR